MDKKPAALTKPIRPPKKFRDEEREKIEAVEAIDKYEGLRQFLYEVRNR